MERPLKKGILIAFEGIDGCGKSTQIRLLQETLEAQGYSCAATAEPTDSPFGKLLRQVLKGEVKSDPRVIAPMFVADRLDHLLNTENGIVKTLEEGTVMLTDRYYFSSYAYQSVDLSMDWVIQANAPCAEIKRPDLTLFLDISPETAMKRILAGRNHVEIFENRKRLEETRDRYLEAFARLKDLEKVAVIDGERGVSEIAQDILTRVKSVLQEKIYE